VERAKGTIAGVVLAAGASRRMGRDKLLLPLAGESLLRRAARASAAAGLSPVVVVLGPDADRARAELGGLGCEVAVNPAPSAALDGSLRAGLAALPASVDAAVVTLADMPLVSAEMIARVVARHQETGAPLVASDYGGVRAPPVLYARRLFAELAAVHGGGGKEVVERHAAESEVVRWPAEALADVDDPGDYERARGTIEGTR
jgi:CTP:molybdopterin cytidylyltransferase MocA